MRNGISLALFMAALAAQTKGPVPIQDYGKFENLGAISISPDGKWVAAAVTRSNRDDELRIVDTAGGHVKTAAFGTQPAFSSDSRWVAYSIGMSEAAEEKLKKDKKPVHRKLGLMNLANGDQSTVDGVESFSFSPNGAFLAMRRYPPEKKDATPLPPDADPEPSGSTLILRRLASGRDTTFGNVSEYSWQDAPKTGRLLAIVISAEDKTGNGVQLFDPESGSLRVLDSSNSLYTGLAWRKKTADLAVLRTQTDDQHEGPTHVALVWTHLNDSEEKASSYDPSRDSSFPTGLRTVSYRRPAWSEDGGIVFLGLGKWSQKPPEKKKGEDAKNEKEKDQDDPPSVDVWHWKDPDVLPKQKQSARNDRQRNLVAAWHIDSGRLVQLGRGDREQVRPLKGQKLAWGADWSAYAMERSIGRPAADLYLIDLANGERAKLREKLMNDFAVSSSPGGRYLLYFEDDHYWTVDVRTKSIANITKNIQTSFADRESDFTVKQKPPFGVAGWTKDDAAVWLHDKFDIWQVTADGSSFKKLTDGTRDEIRHRLVTLDPDAEFIDLSKSVYASLFGIWSKQSGYARIADGREEHLILDGRRISRLAKAQDAEKFAFVSEAWDSPPEVLAGASELQHAKGLLGTNPFLSDYAWGRSELIEYKNASGQRLQGALFYPAGYEAGKKYPMVVYMYERLSDNLHRFSAPSERDYYNAAAFTQHGYLLLMPDIVFKAREPGVSVADCVGAAVNKVIEKGVADAAKVGIVGHSWGGFDTTFLATHTRMFAAGVAGAPITNLVSNYGNHHWSSGIAETDHIETGQQRMEVPLWEDLPAYIRNSAVFNAHNMTTPLLVEVGDVDGTVFFHQGVELYNIARRSGKPVVLLVYAGEDHGLRKKPNQMDYQRRIFAWFGHYLKGEPAEPWITEGQTYQSRQEELKKLKAGK